PYLADPRPLVGQPRPQRALTLPDGVSADSRDERAADHREPSRENVQPADGAERERHQADNDGDGERRLQRAVEQALLTTLGRRAARTGRPCPSRARYPGSRSRPGPAAAPCPRDPRPRLARTGAAPRRRHSSGEPPRRWPDPRDRLRPARTSSPRARAARWP